MHSGLLCQAEGVSLHITTSLPYGDGGGGSVCVVFSGSGHGYPRSVHVLQNPFMTVVTARNLGPCVDGRFSAAACSCTLLKVMNIRTAALDQAKGLRTDTWQ